MAAKATARQLHRQGHVLGLPPRSPVFADPSFRVHMESISLPARTNTDTPPALPACKLDNTARASSATIVSVATRGPTPPTNIAVVTPLIMALHLSRTKDTMTAQVPGGPEERESGQGIEARNMDTRPRNQ